MKKKKKKKPFKMDGKYKYRPAIGRISEQFYLVSRKMEVDSWIASTVLCIEMFKSNLFRTNYAFPVQIIRLFQQKK